MHFLGGCGFPVPYRRNNKTAESVSVSPNSMSEYTQAIGDRRYDSDEAYRARIDAKLVRSRELWAKYQAPQEGNGFHKTAVQVNSKGEKENVPFGTMPGRDNAVTNEYDADGNAKPVVERLGNTTRVSLRG
jgi:hypothetical protein